MSENRKSLTRPAPVKLDAAKLAALEAAFEALPKSYGGSKRTPTPEQAEMLRRYWASGKSRDGMARALGVAEGTMRKWARALGLAG
ncbi:MAG TPA: hypothetical protein VFH17_08560 [Coriobacteriia bacterium]|nr:hypothetical protein [Coriobacteriia bacterium]